MMNKIKKEVEHNPEIKAKNEAGTYPPTFLIINLEITSMNELRIANRIPR